MANDPLCVRVTPAFRARFEAFRDKQHLSTSEALLGLLMSGLEKSSNIDKAWLEAVRDSARNEAVKSAAKQVASKLKGFT